MEKRKITKTLVTAAVKPLDSKITGAQVRDLTQTLIKLRERELARQEKRKQGQLRGAKASGLLGQSAGQNR